MTADELIRAVRELFILDDRSIAASLKSQLPPDSCRELAILRRRERARRRVLFKSKAFRNLATGYTNAGDPDAADSICSLITWLGIWPDLVNGEVTPQTFAESVKAQKDLRQRYGAQLRAMAQSLGSKYSDRLTKIADEIVADELAIRGTETAAESIARHFVDIDHLGSRGGASGATGAWRGWLIRELRSRMPHINVTPDKYATIAGLIAWAGVNGVTSMLVRSILTRS